MAAGFATSSAVNDLPSIPEGHRVYAIGDIHGRLDLLDALHDRIVQDAAARAANEMTVVYLGDYVDRGPASADVIDTLLGAPLPGFDCVHLLGNHEAYLLDFLEDASVGPNWFWNGGIQTLESYGVEVESDFALADGLEDLQAALRAALPANHRAFLEGLENYRRIGDYLFVHAGIRPGVPVESQDPHDLIWIRDEFLASGADHGCVVVHGHSIGSEPELRANRIGIDTGAFMSGVLTCLALEGTGRRFLQTGAG